MPRTDALLPEDWRGWEGEHGVVTIPADDTDAAFLSLSRAALLPLPTPAPSTPPPSRGPKKAVRAGGFQAVPARGSSSPMLAAN